MAFRTKSDVGTPHAFPARVPELHVGLQEAPTGCSAAGAVVAHGMVVPEIYQCPAPDLSLTYSQAFVPGSLKVTVVPSETVYERHIFSLAKHKSVL